MFFFACEIHNLTSTEPGMQPISEILFLEKRDSSRMVRIGFTHTG